MTKHTFTVIPGLNGAKPNWKFDNTKPEKCNVKRGDQIEFVFDGPFKLGECSLLTGRFNNGEPVSPFTVATPVTLQQNQKLTILSTLPLPVETWGFTLAFTLITVLGPEFQYIPDPELQVGST